MNERSKPWTQKHVPTSLNTVMGQDRATLEIKKFVVNFKKERRKGILLYGPTGSGKTCSVYALADEMDLEVVELNASDFRTGEGIASVVGNASKQMSLFAKGKIILVDEIDGVSGTKDRGGIPELIRIIERTSFPIIMTANDPFDKKFSALRKKSKMIEFDLPQHTHVLSLLKRVADAESINYDAVVLESISRRVGGDMRAAINDLQMLSANGNLTKEDLESLSDREHTEEIETALTKIFKTTDPLIAKHAFDTVNDDLNQCILWVDENLPKEYEKPEDLARAYYYVSKANIMSRRIMRWQHWRFLVYVNDYLSAGVAVSKDEKYRKVVSYEQTKRLLKIWLANRSFQKRLAICEKMAEITHCSKKDAVKNTYPYLKAMFQNGTDRGMISKIIDELNLDSEEVAYMKR